MHRVIFENETNVSQPSVSFAAGFSFFFSFRLYKNAQSRVTPARKSLLRFQQVRKKANEIKRAGVGGVRYVQCADRIRHYVYASWHFPLCSIRMVLSFPRLFFTEKNSRASWADLKSSRNFFTDRAPVNRTLLHNKISTRSF